MNQRYKRHQQGEGKKGIVQRMRRRITAGIGKITLFFASIKVRLREIVSWLTLVLSVMTVFFGVFDMRFVRVLGGWGGGWVACA